MGLGFDICYFVMIKLVTYFKHINDFISVSFSFVVILSIFMVMVLIFIYLNFTK